MKELNFKLKREQIEFKPANAWRQGDNVMCSILAYKDARTDMDILDDKVGSMSWQNEYKRDSNGVLQCGISIFNPELSEWITKWSNGVPSDFESAKGEYSDAFKRAGFMWGIGRCLYEFPNIQVVLNEKEYSVNATGKIKVNAWFKPNTWIWQISDDHGIVRAAQKFGNSHTERFNNEPYKK